MKPRLLDLFCGAGGAARGYQNAGFYVIGVDIEPQPNYCGDEFIQGDVFDVWPNLTLYGWSIHFDAVHASPPCQSYTTMSNRWGSDYPELIPQVRELFLTTGLPYVIENVAGAKKELKDPTRLTGEMFGLRVHRPRLFETNWPLLGVPAVPRQKNPVAVYGKNDQRRLWTRADGSELRAATLEEGSEAMGIDWMDWRELCESIPPAYTEFIGFQLRSQLALRKAA